SQRSVRAGMAATHDDHVISEKTVCTHGGDYRALRGAPSGVAGKSWHASCVPFQCTRRGKRHKGGAAGLEQGLATREPGKRRGRMSGDIRPRFFWRLARLASLGADTRRKRNRGDPEVFRRVSTLDCPLSVGF